MLLFVQCYFVCIKVEKQLSECQVLDVGYSLYVKLWVLEYDVGWVCSFDVISDWVVMKCSELLLCWFLIVQVYLDSGEVY